MVNLEIPAFAGMTRITKHRDKTFAALTKA
jgi:hypothetical protein